MISRDAPDRLGGQPQQPDRLRQVDCALSKLREIVLQGLNHGFFEYTVIGEIIGQQKRRLVLKAGKSFQFVIAADELDPEDPS
ncbi:MAG TPA: hypothetical protein VN688_05265 [Gemmataceae bacterium]|nr:hypothetical protein [Gemmataceae bacterium]